MTGGGTKTTYSLYEGNEILYEEGYTGSVRQWMKLNVYANGLNIGRFRKVSGVETVQYFYLDHLGSRRAVTDGSGVVQAKIDYTVWGVPTVTNYSGYDGSLDIAFTGKEYDATKLYYFNARYYDPTIGRFITEDPIRDGLNWFVYCDNNPLSFTDPDGLEKYLVSGSSTFSTMLPLDCKPMTLAMVSISIKTYALIDTEERTADIWSISTDRAYADFDLDSITEARVKIGDVTYSKGILVVSSEPQLLARGSVSLGDVGLDYPPEVKSITIETSTLYRFDSENGLWFLGEQKVTILVEDKK